MFDVMRCEMEWRRKPIHRIYIFTEHGLSPALVGKFFDELQKYGGKMVLDPFVGSGTVLVEAQVRNIASLGIDSNPWALVVSKAKTTFPIGVGRWIEEHFCEIEHFDPFIPSERLSRYHSPEELTALAKIRAAINKAPAYDKPILLTVLANVANRFSKLKRSPAPRFRHNDNTRNEITTKGIINAFFNKLLDAIEDLKRHVKQVPVHLIFGDSTCWLPEKIDAVLTSPPFANNVDYIRHTQLSLLWMGMSEANLGSLRDLQIPGCEAAARKWKKGLYEPWLNPYYNSIGGSRSRGFRRFLAQYLWAMNRHFELLAERLEWEAWYTVGDSVLGGGYIPTHELLAKLAERHGLKVMICPLGPRLKRGLKMFLLRLASPS